MSIALLLPYYGKFPIWINAFLRSCACNPNITWIIFSDLKKPSYIPENVQFTFLRKTDLSALIQKKTGLEHTLSNPHKLCDFKPLYGTIFEDYLISYDYWGHCDMDIIWGDLESFLQSISWNNYDIISTRKWAISGHFTLYRNLPSINNLFRNVVNYQKAFTDESYQGFDEGYFSYFLFQKIYLKQKDIKIYWPMRNSIDRAELFLHPKGWYWQAGKIYNKYRKGGIYIHLIDWKRTFEQVCMGQPENQDFFKINQYGIWDQHIPIQVQLKLILISGFRRRLIRRLRSTKRSLKAQLTGNRKAPTIKANVPKGYEVL